MNSLFVFALVVAATPEGASRCSESLRPLLTPGSRVETCQLRRFDETHLATGDQPDQVARLEGKVVRARWTAPPTEGPTQLLHRHEQALGKLGLRRVYGGQEGSVHHLTLRKDSKPETWVALTVDPINLGQLMELEAIWVEVVPFVSRFEKSAGPAPMDARGCVDPLGLGRIKGSRIDQCEKPRLGELELQLGEKQTKVYEGRLSEVRYVHGEEDSTLEVFHSYRLWLEQAGYAVLHQQEEGSERQLIATRDVDGQPHWVQLAVANVNAGQRVHTYLSLLIVPARADSSP